MRHLFYAGARRGVVLKALFVLAVMAAIAIAGAAPNAFNP